MSAESPATSILAIALGAAACLYGCAAAPDPIGPAADGSLTPVVPGAAAPVATMVDARPAALVGGRSVSWGQLRPLLNEIGGAAALRDVMLDQLLDAELQRTGLVITDDDARAEQKLLLESLSDDPDRALRLLDELRLRQGLGTQRFDRLLRRNAALRALVRGRVSVTDAAVQRMHEVLHGEKRQPRLILVASLAEAREALERLDGGDPFAEVAVEVSIDASAPRGGLLEPISRVDPSYPDALRSALWTLAPGQVSSPILVDGGYAIVQLVRAVPADGLELAAERVRLERAVRLGQERVLMDELARRLLGSVSVTIFDPSLDESWRRARRGPSS